MVAALQVSLRSSSTFGFLFHFVTFIPLRLVRICYFFTIYTNTFFCYKNHISIVHTKNNLQVAREYTVKPFCLDLKFCCSFFFVGRLVWWVTFGTALQSGNFRLFFAIRTVSVHV